LSTTNRKKNGNNTTAISGGKPSAGSIFSLKDEPEAGGEVVGR